MEIDVNMIIYTRSRVKLPLITYGSAAVKQAWAFIDPQLGLYIKMKMRSAFIRSFRVL